MNIGNAIRKIRNDKQVSQMELKRLSGVSQTSISQIEKGLKQPSRRTLEKICKALNVPQSVVYFYSLEDSDVPKDKQQVYEVIYPALESMIRKLIID